MACSHLAIALLVCPQSHGPLLSSPHGARAGISIRRQLVRTFHCCLGCGRVNPVLHGYLAFVSHGSFYSRGIYMFTAAYGMSFGPVGWVLPSEVFPLSMRSKGVALSTASNWFNNCMLPRRLEVDFFILEMTPFLQFLLA